MYWCWVCGNQETHRQNVALSLEGDEVGCSFINITTKRADLHRWNFLNRACKHVATIWTQKSLYTFKTLHRVRQEQWESLQTWFPIWTEYCAVSLLNYWHVYAFHIYLYLLYTARSYCSPAIVTTYQHEAHRSFKRKILSVKLIENTSSEQIHYPLPLRTNFSENM